MLVAPFEVFQHGRGLDGIGLVLVDQDVGGAGNGPALIARLIIQHDVVTRGVFPVGVGCRRLKSLEVRAQKLAVFILELGIGHFILLGIGVFDITDGPAHHLHLAGHAFIAFAADAAGRRPLHRFAGSHFLFPLRRNHGQVAGIDKGGSGTVAAMHHGDGLGGEFHIGVKALDGRVVPPGDFAEVDISQQFPAQLQLSRTDAGNVDHRHHAADDHGKLDQTVLVQVLGFERLIRSAEIHGLGLDLGDAAAGADGLVIDLDPGEGIILVGPLGIDGIGKRRPGPVDGYVGGRRGAGQAHEAHQYHCQPR